MIISLIIAQLSATLRSLAHLRGHFMTIAHPRATPRSLAHPCALLSQSLELRIYLVVFAHHREIHSTLAKCHAKTPCFIAQRGTAPKLLRSWWLSCVILNTSLEIYGSQIVVYYSVYYCILYITINSMYISYSYTIQNTKVKIVKTLTKIFTKIVSVYCVVKPRRGTLPDCIIFLFLVT